MVIIIIIIIIIVIIIIKDFCYNYHLIRSLNCLIAKPLTSDQQLSAFERWISIG